MSKFITDADDHEWLHAAQPDDAAIEFARRFLDGDVLRAHVRTAQPADADFADMGQALQQASIDPDTNDFDVLVGLAADSLRQGEGMPGWLATFAANVLEGKRKRPTKRGRDRYSNWQRDYKLWSATQEVARVFSMPAYTNNELSKKPTAAHAVSLAARCPIDVVVLACRRFNPGRG